jgi:hypothetical protein
MQENASYEENELENREDYTAYAVTLALEEPLEEMETLSQDGIIGPSDVELEDRVVWLMSTITFYIRKHRYYPNYSLSRNIV